MLCVEVVLGLATLVALAMQQPQCAEQLALPSLEKDDRT
jgi:hypothetical protein